MGNFKGVAGELLAMSEAVKKGYNVAKLAETGSSFCMYDFILDDGIKLSRVEVKTSDYLHDKDAVNRQKVMFDLRRHKVASYSYIDIFALVCPTISKIAWIPLKIIGENKRKIIYFKDFKYYELPMNTLVTSEDLKKTTNQLTLFDKEKN
jgi:hypothetical protein